MRKSPVRHNVNPHWRKGNVWVEGYTRGKGWRPGTRSKRSKVVGIQTKTSWQDVESTQKTIPGTDISIDWGNTSYYPKSQQYVLISPELFLLLVPPPAFGYFSRPSLNWIDFGITEKGQPMEALFMDIDIDRDKVTAHEGRHRALWAVRAGIKYVPVVLYHKDEKGEDFYGRKKSRFVDVVESLDPTTLKPQSIGRNAYNYANKIKGPDKLPDFIAEKYGVEQ